MGLCFLIDGVARKEAVHRLDVGGADTAPIGELVRAIGTDLGAAALGLLAQAKSAPGSGCHT